MNIPDNFIFKVADMAGIKIKKSGNQNMGSCPACHKGTKSPSCNYDGKRNSFHCFSCGKAGGVKELASLCGINFRQLLVDNYIIDDSSINSSAVINNDKKNDIKTANKSQEKNNTPINLEAFTNIEIGDEIKAYLKSRGINYDNVKEYVRELKLGVLKNIASYGYGLVIPAIDANNQIKYLKLRNIRGQEPKVRNLEGYSPVAIGMQEARDMNMCLVVEGEIDYLVAKSIGYSNVIAIPTIHYNFHKEELDALPENIYLLCDNDAIGKENIPRLAKQLYSPKNPRRNVFVVKYPVDIKDLADLHKKNLFESSKTIKDLDDMLMNSTTNRYTPFNTSTTLANSILEDIIGKIEDAKEKGLERPEVKTISTGLPDLDDLLDGGLRSGLYGIAGRPGIGKTTFLLAIAKAIIESKENDAYVIFFSLEMTAEELTANLLSWVSGISRSKILDRNIDENGLSILRNSLKKNASLFNRIIIEDKERSVDGMRKLTVDIMNEYEKKCVVIIDFLQQIELKQKHDLRIAMKEVSYNLKDFANSYDIPVLFISSTQREQYKVSDSKNDLLAAFKESGDIEYSLYVGLYLDKMTEEERGDIRIRDFEIPFKLILVKNRHGKCRDPKQNYLNLKLKIMLENGDFKNLEQY